MPANNGRQHISPFSWLIAAIAAFGGLLFGYDTGVISGALLFLRPRFSLSTVMSEVVTSAVLVGAVIGAALGGFLADRWGRRLTIIAAAIVFVLGALGTAFAPVVWWLIIGRGVVGLAIGLASMVAPLYISEMSPARLRGSMVSLNQLAVTLGIVIAYLVDYAFAASAGWRWMFGLAAIPGTILLLGMLPMPASPRWLLSKGREDHARQVLHRIRATGDVEGEVNEIKQSLAQQSGHWRELLRPGVRPALIVGIGLALLQQVTGINTVIYYSPLIFQMAGLTFTGFSHNAVAILAGAIVGVVNFLFTIVAVWLIDRVGRRPLLLVGIAGMVVALGVLGASFALPQLRYARGWIALFSLMAYVASFAVGLGPVFWLLISEIYPLRVRGLAMSAATVVNWASNLAVGLSFLSIIAAIGRPFTFWIFALVGVAAWLFTWFLVPETKGRTLEQIEAHWRAGRHPREMGKAPPGPQGG